jgi:calcineurin-like phosphoesterase family protein
MSNWKFTADLHFDHANIMKHCNRPFDDVEGMNEHLIEQWNKTVRGKDVVIVAGDVTLHSDPENVRYRFTRYLNGNIIFVKGNHDYWIRGRENTRHLYHKKLKDPDVGIAVSHYPMRTWHSHQHGWVNLHGHSHGTLPPLKNQFDVGVDVAYEYFGVYRPFDLDEILEFIKDNNHAIEQLYSSHKKQSVAVETKQRCSVCRGTGKMLNYFDVEEYYKD